MLVESKYFECEVCGEYSIRLIFAPEAETETEILAFSQMMKHDYQNEECEVWIIGPPENESDEDCDHITMQAWPTQTAPESIPATEFNKRIVYLEQHHCEHVTVTDNPEEQPLWQPISILGTYGEMIDGMLDVALE